jgi:hypothetical protein
VLELELELIENLTRVGCFASANNSLRVPKGKNYASLNFTNHNAVKGFDIGAGFDSVGMLGSEHNSVTR